MKTTSAKRTFGRPAVLSLILATTSVSLCATAAMALQPASAQPASATGLNALSDDRLIAELAKRNLPGLLDRAFEQNNWPQDRRKGVLAVMAAEQLRAKSSSISYSQKQALVKQVTQGISGALPTITDAEMLYRSAETLLADGIRDDIALLEYWGASSTTQVRVRPVIDAVVSMLDRSGEITTKERADIEKQLENSNPNQATLLQRKYGQLEDLANTTGALRIETDYNLALSMDKSDARRAEALGRVVETLTPLDTAENPARNTVRFVLAKAKLALGTPESLGEARSLLDAIANTPGESDGASLPFESRYFRTVVEVLAQKPADAQKQFEGFTRWIGANKPQDAAAAASVQATAQLLEYRVTQLAGDKAKATQTLLKLVDAQPQFREVILQQLLSGIDQTTPLTTLDPLLLSALADAGRREAIRPESETADAAVLTRAIGAAQETIRRKATPGVRNDQVEEASFLVPFFKQRQGDKIGAANAFLDYADQFRAGSTNSAERGPAALDNAMGLIGQLRQQDITDPEVSRAYDRVFPIALSAPYNRKELLFTWADRLRRLGKSDEAATFFRQIPATDRNYATARYLLLISLAQRLDQIKTGDAQRAAIVTEIQALAGEVRAAGQAGGGQGAGSGDK